MFPEGFSASCAMYKLFLTFRYLTRKAIVIFPILVVWLCVMMMIIVTSIMGGFVERVQDANRQLLGDVVIDAQTLSGWPYYEELQDELKKMPEVEICTPVIQAYGLINLVDDPASARPLLFNNIAQIIGIDPAARAKLSRFGEGLFWQYTAPREAAEDLAKLIPALGTATSEELRKKAYTEFEQAQDASEKYLISQSLPKPLTPTAITLYACGGVLLLVGAGAVMWGIWKFETRWKPVRVLLALTLLGGTGYLGWYTWQRSDLDKQFDLQQDQAEQANARVNRALRSLDYSTRLPAHESFSSREQLLKAIAPAQPTFTPPPDAIRMYGSKENTPENGCIVGIDVIPMYKRDRRGNYLHNSAPRYWKAMLTLAPISESGAAKSTVTMPFVIVDDSYTRIYDVDKTSVYAPFEVVQQMARMNGGVSDTGKINARCNELQLKIKNGDDPVVLKEVTQRINDKIAQLIDRHIELRNIPNLRAQTWDEKQIQYIRAVRNEKHMITFILGLMSLVVLVVIFLIFYMIVRDKTRDIGIIKALGGSEEGVAGIFMMYGLFIGLVGGLMGMVTGVLFVWHTNEIHEWIYRTTGIMIWDRKVYLFDRIPDTVNWWEVLTYVGAAVVAGLIGALIPAIVAGVQNPVRAVRYE